MICKKPFGLLESIVSIIVQNFCHVICIHLLPIMISKLIPFKISEISAKFEKIDGLPYIKCNR